MSQAPFAVSGHQLRHRGDVLLTGPVDQLARLADELNAAPPGDEGLAATVWAWMQTTRGCSFVVGPGLVWRGWYALVPMHRYGGAA